MPEVSWPLKTVLEKSAFINNNYLKVSDTLFRKLTFKGSEGLAHKKIF